MKLKSILAFAMLALVLSSCGNNLSKKLYGDWYPVHAKGSYEDNFFSARWDGELDEHGSIEIEFLSKTTGKATKRRSFYSALSFTKDSRKNEKFRYISLENLYQIKRSDMLDYRTEDGLIYFEKQDSNGKGTGEFEEGRKVTFVNDNTIMIGDVTYESYEYYREKRRGSKAVDLISPSEPQQVGLFKLTVPSNE